MRQLLHRFLIGTALVLIVASMANGIYAFTQGLLLIGVGHTGGTGAAAITTVKYGLPYPPWPTDSAGGPATGNCLIDAADEECAIIYTATTAKEIDGVYFYVNTVTTGCTLDVRVETVNASGDPSDTLFDVNSNVAAVIDGTDNTWRGPFTLTANATPAIGEKVAITIKNPASSFCNGNVSVVEDAPEGTPYGDLFAAAAWTKQTSPVQIIPVYSDGTFEPQLGMSSAYGQSATMSTTYATDTATTEMGNEFSLPFSARACGVWAWVDGDGDFAVKLMSNDGVTTHATTGTQTAAHRGTTSAGIYVLPFDASVASTFDMVKSTTYRVEIVPTTVTDITGYFYTIATAAMMDNFAGGTTLYRSNKISGTYTDDTTQRVLVGLMLCGFMDA